MRCPASQLTSTATHRTTTASTTRPAPTACSPRTPPCSLTAPPRVDTSSSSVSSLLHSNKLTSRTKKNPLFFNCASFLSSSPLSTNRRIGAVRIRDLQEAGRVSAVSPAVPFLRHRWDPLLAHRCPPSPTRHCAVLFTLFFIPSPFRSVPRRQARRRSRGGEHRSCCQHRGLKPKQDRLLVPPHIDRILIVLWLFDAVRFKDRDTHKKM